jgi:hypothetical protein
MFPGYSALQRLLCWPARLTVIDGCAFYAGWLAMLAKISAADAGYAGWTAYATYDSWLHVLARTLNCIS